MNFNNPIWLAILVLVVIALGFWIVAHYLSPESRRERRRRRSNSRLASSSKRPMVKFSVRTKKD